MAKLIDIKGFTRTYANKFSRQGIRSVNGFLSTCAALKNRRAFAKQFGIRLSQLNAFVARADLFRVKGVGRQYADLLETAGVENVQKLAAHKPQQLFQQLKATNDSKNIVQSLPSIRNVRSWITQAKRMKKVA